MKNSISKSLLLFTCIMMSSTTHATAGSADRPDQFSPCPDSPNCVSTQSTDSAHYIEPLQYGGSLADARKKLIEILENTKRVRMVKVGTNYVHAEFRSRIFQFVDDVEFYFPPEESVIHVKSASQSGYYDFGANRRRVEWLRSVLKKSAR